VEFRITNAGVAMIAGMAGFGVFEATTKVWSSGALKVSPSVR
jgi:hypothetical protein